MSLLLPLFILFCIAMGAFRRVPLYDAFLDGAKEGLGTAKSILPALIAMLCAIRGFEQSGLMKGLCNLMEPLFCWAGLPRETLPLALMRPLSGSASLAMLQSILETYGPDSPIGMTASVMMGSTETIFYTCGVYLAAAGVKKSRHAIPCALIAWLVSTLAAGMMAGGG